MKVKRISISVPADKHYQMKMEAKNKGTTLSKLLMQKFDSHEKKTN
jgi:ribosomal protein L33